MATMAHTRALVPMVAAIVVLATKAQAVTVSRTGDLEFEVAWPAEAAARCSECTHGS